MIYRRVEKESDELSYIWSGHSLRSANQLLAREVNMATNVYKSIFDETTFAFLVSLLPDSLLDQYF